MGESAFRPTAGIAKVTRDAVREADEKSKALRERMLIKAAGVGFYKASRLDLARLLDDPNQIAANLTGYLHGFSPNVRDILEPSTRDIDINQDRSLTSFRHLA